MSTGLNLDIAYVWTPESLRVVGAGFIGFMPTREFSRDFNLTFVGFRIYVARNIDFVTTRQGSFYQVSTQSAIFKTHFLTNVGFVFAAQRPESGGRQKIEK